MTFLKRYWALVVLIVFFVAGGALYLSGYRLGPGLTIERLATLTISNLPQHAEVFIDDSNRSQTSATFSVRLLPGQHTVIASAQGFWPWKSIVSVTGPRTSVEALLIPTSPKISILTGSKATQVRKKISEYQLPDTKTPLLFAEGCVAVTVAQNRIIATGSNKSGCAPLPYLCSDGQCAPTIVFSPTEEIASVIAYPSRSNALIVSVGTHVFGLSLDPREPRAFAPLIEGKHPVVINDGDTIYGADGITTFSIEL